MQRLSFFSAVGVIFLLVSSPFAHAAATSATFATNLSLGSSGPEVLALQKILNSDPATAVAASGPGSPGNETGYFGSLTKRAVMQFQQKYQSEVLAPAGLLSPNGYVGAYTRAKLNSLALSPAKSVLSVASPSQVATSSLGNPNASRVAKAITYVDALAKRRGLTNDEITRINKGILDATATSTDLQAAFMKRIGGGVSVTSDSGSLTRFGALVTTLVKNLIGPEKAYAGIGSPFGGEIIIAYPCTCGADWDVIITPEPPDFVVSLDYLDGSQAYSSYNIPTESTWILGEYQNGAGNCEEYVGTACTQIPTEGQITPTVGSSGGL